MAGAAGPVPSQGSTTIRIFQKPVFLRSTEPDSNAFEWLSASRNDFCHFSGLVATAGQRGARGHCANGRKTYQCPWTNQKTSDLREK